MPFFDATMMSSPTNPVQPANNATPKKKPLAPQDGMQFGMIKPPNLEQDPFISTNSPVDHTLRLGAFGTTNPPAPAPGTARAWSSQGPADRHTPVQQFSVPVGPQHAPPQPAPIGAAWRGFGSYGANGGGSSMAPGPAGAGENIKAFYDSIGMPLSEVMSNAQRDEGMARNAWMARTGDEQTTRMMQQEMMAHQLQHAPQNEALKALDDLSRVQMFNPTPEGAALMKHYMSMLMPHSAQGQPTQPAGSTQPQVQPAPNEHPGLGGMLHAFLHRGLPAAAGAGGWGAAAALAPETGMASFLIPAAASAASYFGANKLADAVDPSGVGAAQEHPIASLAGQAAGGYYGYKGFGKLGSKATPAPAGTNGADNPTEGGPTILNPTAQANQAAFGSEYNNPNVRQMSPFGNGQVQPGQTPVAPISRQLGMGELGAQASVPAPNLAMSGDPQVEAALQNFKNQMSATAPQALQVAPQPYQAEQFQLPLQQQTPAMPGMRSTAMPSANAKQAPIATNPVQMPQQPVAGVPSTLDVSQLTPERLAQVIGDPRLREKVVHDVALQQLLQKYLLSPAQ